MIQPFSSGVGAAQALPEGTPVTISFPINAELWVQVQVKNLSGPVHAESNNSSLPLSADSAVLVTSQTTMEALLVALSSVARKGTVVRSPVALEFVPKFLGQVIKITATASLRGTRLSASAEAEFRVLARSPPPIVLPSPDLDAPVSLLVLSCAPDDVEGEPCELAFTLDGSPPQATLLTHRYNRTAPPAVVRPGTTVRALRLASATRAESLPVTVVFRAASSLSSSRTGVNGTLPPSNATQGQRSSQSDPGSRWSTPFIASCSAAGLVVALLMASLIFAAIRSRRHQGQDRTDPSAQDRCDPPAQDHRPPALPARVKALRRVG